MRALNIAIHDLELAAAEAKRRADVCNALVGLIKASTQPENNAPLPIEALAQALLSVDLCIVHRAVVLKAMNIIGDTDDADGLSGAEIYDVARRLELAHQGRAQ